MANFSAKFIKNYSDRTAKIGELTKEMTKWEWTDGHEQDFQDLKDCLTDSCFLHYFDPKLETPLSDM